MCIHVLAQHDANHKAVGRLVHIKFAKLCVVSSQHSGVHLELEIKNLTVLMRGGIQVRDKYE
jgi:hypothetical protein